MPRDSWRGGYDAWKADAPADGRHAEAEDLHPCHCYRCGRALTRANMVVWSSSANGPICRNRTRCDREASSL